MRTAQHLMSLARRGWTHRTWYEDCQPSLWAASKYVGTTRMRFIDVLSLTSPRCAVTRNVRITVHYLKTGELLSGVIRTTRTALAHYEQTGEIRGPKTGRFADALKGDGNAIVLDTWMARALGVPQTIFATQWGRSVSERRVRYGAYIMGIQPAQFQAAVWSGTVLQAGRKVPRIDRVIEEIIT